MMTDAEVADQIDRADRFIGRLREAIIATVVDPASLCADEQRRVSYCGFSRRCHFGHQRRAALIARIAASRRALPVVRACTGGGALVRLYVTD